MSSLTNPHASEQKKKKKILGQAQYGKNITLLVVLTTNN